VVVDQAAGLHQRVERGRSDEAKATALELARERDALGHRGGHVGPGRRRPLARGRRVRADQRVERLAGRTETANAWLVEFQNGKGVRIREYLDPDEALEAAVLQE
jgi:hypothetical protein